MQQILVPIFICVVLPVSIVLIYFLAKMNNDNKRAQIIIKAIEANNDIDTDKLAESLKRPEKSDRQILNLRLLRGCMFSLVGLALIIIGLFNLSYDRNFYDDPVCIPMLFGGSILAIGISYLIVYFVTRKQVDNSNRK